jgi:hypothetical protein
MKEKVVPVNILLISPKSDEKRSIQTLLINQYAVELMVLNCRRLPCPNIFWRDIIFMENEYVPVESIKAVEVIKKK